MPIKGLFKQNQNNENINEKMAELEKKYLKLNALEVRVNKLEKLEGKMYSILKWKDENKANKLNANRQFDNKPLYPEDKIHASIHRKVDPLIERIDTLATSIAALENQFSVYKSSDSAIFNRLEELEEANSLEQINMLITYIQELENKILLQNQREESMLARLESLEEKVSAASREEKVSEQPVVINEVRIDKFYLDKYEQNNNIAQLGIKDLSGALNIGATYGKDTIPKEVSDQIKEDLQEMTSLKAEKGDNKQTDESESSSSEEPFDPEEFTEIPIDFQD